MAPSGEAKVDLGGLSQPTSRLVEKDPESIHLEETTYLSSETFRVYRVVPVFVPQVNIAGLFVG